MYLFFPNLLTVMSTQNFNKMYNFYTTHVFTNFISYLKLVFKMTDVFNIDLPVLIHQYNGSRFVQILPEKDFSHAPFDICHLDTVKSGVCPVNFLPYRVHNESIWSI